MSQSSIHIMSEEEFYKELTSRNYHFIKPDIQKKLKSFSIFIAGCGSTGGACIESLARVGVCNFYLADNGSYDLSNLNRQHARTENIGQNKALFHQQELLAINPFIQVKADSKGVHKESVDEFVKNSDIVFDAVDVTTDSGIKAKLLLHERAFLYKKPVFSALDLGYLQWGRSYDYRTSKHILDGRAQAAINAKHPIAALLAVVPPKIIPSHCYQFFLDLLEEKVSFASQLGCCSDSLSAIIVPVILQYLEFGTLQKTWSLDLNQFRMSKTQRFFDWNSNRKIKGRFLKKLSQLS